MLPRALLACVSLCGALSAQTTWIVDQNGGPGTNFTSIAPAVAAATAGDVILVRPGTYAIFTVSKGVKILGQPSFTVSQGSFSPISIIDLPANETLILANATVLSFGSEISVTNAAGHVHIQNVQFMPNDSDTAGLTVSGSSDVTVSDCTFARAWPGFLPIGLTPAVSVDHSDVTLVGSTIYGRIGGSFANPGFPPGHVLVFSGKGLVVSESTVHLSRCDVAGGGFPPPSPIVVDSAVDVTGSALTVTGLAANFVRGESGVAAIFADIESTVAIDTQLGVQGALTGGATFVKRRIVTLDANGGSLGGTIAIDAVSPQDDICVLLLGLPYAPTPSPIGPLRINLATAVLLAQQVVPASELTTATINVPNAVVLRGLLLGFQAANWDHTTGTIEVSNVVDLVLQ